MEVSPSPLLHKNSKHKVNIGPLTNNQEALLPVISANIGGQSDMYKRGNVLLYTGVQISLIRIIVFGIYTRCQ